MKVLIAHVKENSPEVKSLSNTSIDNLDVTLSTDELNDLEMKDSHDDVRHKMTVSWIGDQDIENIEDSTFSTNDLPCEKEFKSWLCIF